METYALILTIIGTVVAVASYLQSNKNSALEKKTKLIQLHGQNVVEMEKLMIQIHGYIEAHNAANQDFIQGFTYQGALDFLDQQRLLLMNAKKNLEDYGQNLPTEELEKNIQRLTDNLNQFD